MSLSEKFDQKVNGLTNDAKEYWRGMYKGLQMRLSFDVHGAK